MRLIVTRPQADAAALSRRLAARGHEAVPAPLLAIVPRLEATIPPAAWQAVALTSANAARVLAAHHDAGKLADVKAFTVGAQSAAAARAAGFGQVIAAGGDARALARALSDRLAPAAGPILYLSGAATAGDIQGELQRSGFEVRRVVLYDAKPARELAPAAARGLASGTVDGVLLYSPRTARIWTALIARAGLSGPAARLTHYCLSANVAAALAGGSPAKVAARPDGAALLALLDDAP